MSPKYIYALILLLFLEGCGESIKDRLNIRLVERDLVRECELKIGMRETEVEEKLGHKGLIQFSYKTKKGRVSQWTYYSNMAYSNFSMEEDDIGISRPHSGIQQTSKERLCLIFVNDQLVDIYDYVKNRHITAVSTPQSQDEEVQKVLRELRERLPK